jgi:hypothetical protein
MSRCAIVVVDDFYRDPEAVRRYAVGQDYYLPYEQDADVQAGRARATWWATNFRPADRCPFKSSDSLIAALERAVGEQIDRESWTAEFPVDAQSRPIVTPGVPALTSLWNCCFHVKPDCGPETRTNIHNHLIDSWNAVGRDGWAGIVYLSPGAADSSGLQLWRHVEPSHDFDWMTPVDNWQPTDSLANKFNRLTLFRGDLPHSGAPGWGDSIETGRMYQTFFFRTIAHPGPLTEVVIPGVGA